MYLKFKIYRSVTDFKLTRHFGAAPANINWIKIKYQVEIWRLNNVAYVFKTNLF